jgi:hypothetical protein
MRLAIACALIALAAQSGSRVAAPSVRFHHYHFRTGEPAAVMNTGAAALKGIRVLLRGLGVGVRVDKQYALFDRVDAKEAFTTVKQPPDTVYAAARDWLRANGVEVAEDDAASRQRLGAAFAAETLDHVAFTAAEPAKVVAALVARGARVIRTTADATLFGVEATTVEIVRDLDRPDAFWCPMHPDIRAQDSGICPVCRMTLVPIPPPRIGEYRMDVAITPGPRGTGASKLRLTIRDPETGRPVPSFIETHERLLHLFVIDRSLEYFGHLHPASVGPGVFELRESLPAGEYVVIADFLPQGGGTQMLQRAIVTPGHRGRMFPAAPALVPDDADEKQDAGVRVRLQASGLRAGKEAMLRFTLTEAATGQEVTDLEPFLGAPAHMLSVNADLTEADHAHPEEATTTGPTITFQPLMPAAGSYKLWLQFQRRGIVSTIPFVVSVDAR